MLGTQSSQRLFILYLGGTSAGSKDAMQMVDAVEIERGITRSAPVSGVLVFVRFLVG